MPESLKESALRYHRSHPPGKLAITPTKPLGSQRDLALAYSPGVAAACEAIVDDPLEAANLTARGNLVAVVSNGTAVLGLGNIGALAGKPVMEGKAVLFKKFAGVDVFDIEVNESDPDKFIDIVAALEPTFGGVNLEDIKAPECFEIERRLQERMNIPVFHDDQHGTAIVTAAAVTNGLRLVGKDIGDVRLAASGAGAAATACINLLVTLGLKRENVVVSDRQGVIRRDRENLTPEKAIFATDRDLHTLAEAMDGADIFLGLSGPGTVDAEMIRAMAANPMVLALANPTPEILPDEVKKVRADALIATGRSDFPNQVNNVLCFPFLFRGALDVGATQINPEMKMAAVRAIADLAAAPIDEKVANAYVGERLQFGPEYLIPKPFDPRLIVQVASGVAQAAMESGVATRPIADFEAYRRKLSEFVHRSGQVMRPIIEQARVNQRRIVFAQGEEERVLRAAQLVIDERVGRPVLVGDARVIEARLGELGLAMRPGVGFDLVDPQNDGRIESMCGEYHRLMERKGVTPQAARQIVRGSPTVVGGLLVRRGDADALLCGAAGQVRDHLRHVRDVVGRAQGVRHFSALSVLILPRGMFFLCDTHVIADPTAEQIAEMTVRAAAQVRRFGVPPKAALLSSSSFGSYRAPHTEKMRRALELLRELAPDLEVEGEMRADEALSEEIRKVVFPHSRLQGQANLLIMPNLDAANIAYTMLRVLGDGVTIGPILLGAAAPAHVLPQTVSVRGLVNMAAVAAVQAQGGIGRGIFGV